MKKIFSIVLFFISAGNCFAQQVTFQKTYGGVNFDFGFSVQQTTDEGYIIAGTTSSFGAGNSDIYLLKTDSIGNSLWTKTFDRAGYEEGYSVQQTMDGGYIIAGETYSFGAGDGDVYLIKTNASGDSLWTKSYGGAFDADISYSVQQTIDGGYIITGETNSFGAGSADVYLIKADANGDSLWTKTFGGTLSDHGASVQQTTDGGYIITGFTNSFGAGDWDVYLLKTDSSGNTIWTKTFGGAGSDFGNSIQQTSDGGFIIAGRTSSSGAGNDDVYLIKTDSNGDSIWTKTFDGTGHQVANSVQQTSDGGYIIAGSTLNFAAFNDVYLIKTATNGDLLWTKTFGGTDNDISFSIHQTSDAGYIITGNTYSFGAGGYDAYLIKTDSLGSSGCNEGSITTIVTTAVTQVTNPSTIVTSPPTIVTSPVTIVGNGGIVTTLCTTVGISPTPALPGREGVAIAPNPSSEIFLITFPNTINKGIIEIYTVLGEKIFNENISTVSQKEIYLKNTAAGIYFVKVRNGEKEYSKKLVIE